MKRIIMHWTAGAHKVSQTDRRHYHFIVAGDGRVAKGNFPVEANENPVKGKYAAHTLNANTGAIGVAIACMAGAKEKPLVYGKYPPTKPQVDALVHLVAKLSRKYDIPVDPTYILTHAEVQPTLKIKQRGKWDIAALPWIDVQGPLIIGNYLRARISDELNVMTYQPIPKKPAGIALLLAAVASAIAYFWQQLTDWISHVFVF